MPDEKQLDFENMDDEQLLDALNENPKAFVSAITKQVRADIERESEQRAEEDRFVKTYQDFQEQYPNFEGLWESGRIKDYMDEHPGHNALSAYLRITHDARIKEAVAKKLQEKGIGEGSLSDTKKFGGTSRVLADRLKALRSQGGRKKPTMGETESGDLKPTI